MTQEIGPGPAGRDFIRILRAHMKYGAELVGNAITEGVRLGSARADFVIALVARARRVRVLPEETDIETYPQLAGIKVTLCPSPEQYQTLLAAQRGVDK